MLVSVIVFFFFITAGQEVTERKENPLDKVSLQTLPSWRSVFFKLTSLGQGASKTL